MNALILVDLQNDFFPGGKLAVKAGDEILPAINELLKCPFDIIVATKDWHPPNHGSFAVNHGKKVGEHILLNGLDQILWPEHCVQNTPGAQFAPGWDTHKVNNLIYKGTHAEIDSYSTFFDNGHLRSTGLEEYLDEMGVDEVFIAGLATDYCVKYSVLDALKLGFTVYVVADACRGVNINPQDSEQALFDMQYSGAHLVTTENVKRMLAT